MIEKAKPVKTRIICKIDFLFRNLIFRTICTQSYCYWLNPSAKRLFQFHGSRLWTSCKFSIADSVTRRTTAYFIPRIWKMRRISIYRFWINCDQEANHVAKLKSVWGKLTSLLWISKIETNHSLKFQFISKSHFRKCQWVYGISPSFATGHLQC